MLVDDIQTVIWKEWKSLFRWRGGRTKAILTMMFPLGVFAFYVPWDSGDHWVQGIPSVFAAVALPLLVAVLIVPDSFAGERERHTLPTLLSSRLPDRAILWGKVSFALALAWGAALTVLVLGLVTFNVTHWSGEITFYSPKIAFVDVTFSLLLGAIAVGVGILVSLGSETVQESQQTMTAALFVPPTVIGPIVLMIGKIRPEWRPKVLLGDLGSVRSLMIILTVLVIVNGVVLALTAARFRRAKLV